MAESTHHVSSSFSIRSDSAIMHHSYNRKEKSLGRLCTNFLTIYNRPDVKSLGLDDAAARLGVERRRIYDIVNVIENIGMIKKKGKSEYSWIGLDGIPKVLNELKEEALRESRFSDFDGSNIGRDLEDNDDERSLDLNSVGWQDKPRTMSFLLQPCSSTSLDKKREKSLGHLTQFCQAFPQTQPARILLGDPHNPSEMQNNMGARAKVRRLYDIANVLSSINLIERTNKGTTSKPAFRWLGIGAMDSSSRKRVFGTEITNTNHKRNKVVKDKPNQKVDLGSCTQKSCEENPKGFAFGPFRPISFPRFNSTGKNNGKMIQERLASMYHPRYDNEALHDLFVHYIEAWKTWYSKVSEKQPFYC